LNGLGLGPLAVPGLSPRVQDEDDRQIPVGRVSGVFGVKGWVRVFSFTDPPDSILNYGPWTIGESPASVYRVTAGSSHGRGVIAHLAGIDDRDAARALIGRLIKVSRSKFAALGAGEYYWADLLGLEVVNQQGVALGRVQDLMETGANDVLVVQGRERLLVPFVLGSVIRSVDLESGRIIVDWAAGS